MLTTKFLVKEANVLRFVDVFKHVTVREDREIFDTEIDAEPALFVRITPFEVTVIARFFVDLDRERDVVPPRVGFNHDVYGGKRVPRTSDRKVAELFEAEVFVRWHHDLVSPRFEIVLVVFREINSGLAPAPLFPSREATLSAHKTFVRGFGTQNHPFPRLCADVFNPRLLLREDVVHVFIEVVARYKRLFALREFTLLA